MDFVYIDDIARANVLALQSDISDDVFNIASGTETSLNELATALLGDGIQSCAGIRPRAKSESGLAPACRCLESGEIAGFPGEDLGLEEGLQRLVSWWSRLAPKAAA